MLEAGLPAGVLNVIPTSTAGATTGPLIKDPRLRKLSFTGSTEVGRRLLADASETVLRTSMELGGNAPFVVFEDADLDAAVAGAMLAKLRNMGEACTAANRFIVHESVADEFAEKFAAKMARHDHRPRHRGRSPRSGPLIDAKSRDKVHELVTDAVPPAPRRRSAAPPWTGPGYFYQPTILDRRHRGHPDPVRGDLRAGRPDHHLRHRGRGRPAGQQHRVRPGGLRLHQGPEPRASGWASGSRPACWA